MYNFLKDFSEEDIIYSMYGLLLGDGHYLNGRIRIEHTEKQKTYCLWLEELFAMNNINVSSRYNYIKKTTFGIKSYNYISLKVTNRQMFENYFFDSSNKKIVSDFVLKNINEVGLLFWFLDDGCLHVSVKNNRSKRFAYLNTQSFSLDENKRIVEMFKTRFNIELKIHKDSSGFDKYKDKVYYRLYFNATNFRKFFDIVRPFLQFIPKDFYYKFNMKYYPNRLKTSKIFSEKYNLTA